MMRVDGRRLVRAAALGFVCFLMIGGGVGFALAATSSDGPLVVPEPRPGDRATYASHKSLIPEQLKLGGRNDVQLDEVSYEWMPERWVKDASFAPRLAHPLRASYVFGKGSSWETIYDREILYDAITGQPLFWSAAGTEKEQPYLVPGVIGHIGAGVDQVVQPPTDIAYRGDVYYVQRIPCGMMTPLHGQAYNGSAFQAGGRCGWPDAEEPTYQGAGWATSHGLRSFRFVAQEDSRLQLWYDPSSPFPSHFSVPMAEIIDFDWTLGRLFTLERTSASAGTGSYTPAAQVPAPQGPGALPLAARTSWMVDDTGMTSELPLSKAYDAAARAPRDQNPTSIGGHQPSVQQWMASHPDGYLALAYGYTIYDKYGQANPNWILAWVDGDSWVGKHVSFQVNAGYSDIFLPRQASRSPQVEDGWPTMPDRPSQAFPPASSLPSAMPRFSDAAARYVAEAGHSANVTYYGFRLGCQDNACTVPAFYMWVGQYTDNSTAGSGTVNGGQSVSDDLLVDGDGQTAMRFHRVDSRSPLLPLTQTPANPPPEAASVAAPAPWLLPGPDAAAGISLLGLLAGVLYYFWPALKASAFTPLFSRIEDDDLLANPVRARIVEAVRSEPGVHFQELARRAAIGRSSLDHHVRKLVDADILSMRRTSGYTCYFPKGAVDRRVMDAAPLLRSGGGRAVLDAVGQNPGVSSRDLAQHLGLAPSTVSYHLKRFEAAGLILPGVKAGARLTALGEQAAA